MVGGHDRYDLNMQFANFDKWYSHFYEPWSRYTPENLDWSPGICRLIASRDHQQVLINSGPFLLTWININLSMDKWSQPV